MNHVHFVGSVMAFLAKVYKIEEIFGKAKTDCKIHNFSQNFIYTKKSNNFSDENILSIQF